MTSKAATVPVIAGATRRVGALLPKHCRSSRPYVALLARALPRCIVDLRVLRVLPCFHSFVTSARRCRRPWTPSVLGRINRIFSFPDRQSVRPFVFSTVLEQSEPGMITRVISESHYLFGISSGWPECAQSTRTMIARRVPSVRQPGSLFIDNGSRVSDSREHRNTCRPSAPLTTLFTLKTTKTGAL